VRGVSRLSEGSVRDKAQLAEGRPVDPAAVARARGRIDSLYRAQGYYLAQVKVVEVFEADSARVRVIFDVDEGPARRRGARPARRQYASPDGCAGRPDENPPRRVLVVSLR